MYCAGHRIFFIATALFFGLSSIRPLDALELGTCASVLNDMRIAACTALIRKGGLSKEDTALVYSSRGAGYINKGDTQKAIADFEAGLRSGAEGAAAHNLRGQLLAAKKDKDGAIAEYSQALALEPNSFRALISRGNVYNTSPQTRDKAIADFTAAIKANPTHPLGYSNRGNALNLRGEQDRAITDLDEAIRLEPRFASAWRNRGHAYLSKGDYETAIHNFNEAIRLDPGNVAGRTALGQVYAARKEYDAAIKEYDAAIKLDPNNAGAFNSRGYAYYLKNDRARALADYEASIRADPSNSWPYNNRGLIKAHNKDHAGAIADFDKAVSLDANYAAALMNRGLSHIALGDKAGAIQDYSKVLDLPAHTPSEKQRQAVARERIGRLKEPQPRAGTASTTPAAVPRATRVALVIGNSKYSNAGLLTNPTNDAKSVAEALRRLNFGLVTELYDASREQMAKALKDFGDRADGAEWAVVFFAGHGIELNGQTYILPTDVELKRDTHVDDEAISLTRVQAKVDAASKLGLVMLDSCRNNPFAARMVRSAGATRAVTAGLAPVEPEGNVLVSYSAKAGTVAADGEGKHSPFTEALLANIEVPDLEVGFLFRRVRDEVRKKTDKKQEPWLYGSLSSEPLYFKTASTASVKR